MEKNIVIKDFLLLNALFLVYSTTGIFLKSASQHDFLSLDFLFYFILAIIGIIIYAVGWQQALKKISLSSAYMNKSIVTVWGIIWSVIFFHETIDVGIIFGGIIILSGILLVVKE